MIKKKKVMITIALVASCITATPVAAKTSSCQHSMLTGPLSGLTAVISVSGDAAESAAFKIPSVIA